MNKMKKIGIAGFILTALAFVVFCGYLYIKPRFLEKGIEINSDNFPDDKLREFAATYDKRNDGNGFLSETEIEHISMIELAGCENLKGIEYFTSTRTIKLTSCQDISAMGALENLTSIELNGCPNVNVDLSKYSKLFKLGIDTCELKYDLNFDGFESLQSFSISDSVLGKLNVSNCPKLERGCIYRSQLEEASVSDCVELDYFELSKIPNVKKCSVENCPDVFKVFFCDCPELTSLEVDNCQDLYNIVVLGDTGLKEMTVKGSPILYEAFNDKDNLEEHINKWDGTVYLRHDNGTKVEYSGDVEFIIE